MQELFPLESSWIVALAAVAVALIMLLRLSRLLPGQNLVMVVAGLLAGEVLIELLEGKISRVVVTGPRWCYLAGAALLWLAVVLSARRLGKLILRPWRAAKYYGLWLIAMSAVETALFQFGWPCFDPDFVDLKKATLMAVIRGLGTVVLLVVLSPWFIRKRPVSRAGRSELAQQPENQAQQKAEEQTSR